MTVNEVQEQIIDQFSILEGDRWMTIEYLIDLGKKLPEFPVEYKTEEYTIKGCLSKVWLKSSLNDGRINFQADSDSETIKGLISLLIKTFNERIPSEIINSNIYFFEKLGLERYITARRGGGFAAMNEEMKKFAVKAEADQIKS